MDREIKLDFDTHDQSIDNFQLDVIVTGSYFQCYGLPYGYTKIQHLFYHLLVMDTHTGNKLHDWYVDGHLVWTKMRNLVD